MARSKQSARPVLSHPPRPRPHVHMAMMRSSKICSGYYKSASESSSKKPKKPEVVDLSAEIRALELDIANNSYLHSTRPRQQPAMTRYHGAPPRAQVQVPKVKRRHRRSWKNRERPTKPEVPTPLTEVVAPPTSSEVHAPRSRPEVNPPRMQPEVIDLTKED